MGSRLISGVAVLLITCVTAAAFLPAWLGVLLCSLALALLYIVVRLNSRFDPLDPRFGSCIPPITRPRESDGP